jgi:histidyl-tRNA synthetase
VFEFVTEEIGAQGTVCGGGRYDGLIAQLGGGDIPALGFGIGLERLLLLMQAQNTPFPEEPKPDIFFAAMGKPAAHFAARLAGELRENGVYAQFDLMGRSLKAQMKYAGKLRAAYTLVLGESELASRRAVLKNMESGETQETALDGFGNRFAGILLANRK